MCFFDVFLLFFLSTFLRFLCVFLIEPLCNNALKIVVGDIKNVLKINQQSKKNHTKIAPDSLIPPTAGSALS